MKAPGSKSLPPVRFVTPWKNDTRFAVCDRQVFFFNNLEIARNCRDTHHWKCMVYKPGYKLCGYFVAQGESRSRDEAVKQAKEKLAKIASEFRNVP